MNFGGRRRRYSQQFGQFRLTTPGLLLMGSLGLRLASWAPNPCGCVGRGPAFWSLEPVLLYDVLQLFLFCRILREFHRGWYFRGLFIRPLSLHQGGRDSRIGLQEEVDRGDILLYIFPIWESSSTTGGGHLRRWATVCSSLSIRG